MKVLYKNLNEDVIMINYIHVHYSHTEQIVGDKIILEIFHVCPVVYILMNPSIKSSLQNTVNELIQAEPSTKVL